MVAQHSICSQWAWLYPAPGIPVQLASCALELHGPHAPVAEGSGSVQGHPEQCLGPAGSQGKGLLAPGLKPGRRGRAACFIQALRQAIDDRLHHPAALVPPEYCLMYDVGSVTKVTLTLHRQMHQSCSPKHVSFNDMVQAYIATIYYCYLLRSIWFKWSVVDSIALLLVRA